MTRDADAVVVGAGPAGAAVACFLARSGADVVVLDRASFPRDKPCAEYLSPQALRILAELGALSALDRASAVPLAGMRVVAPDGREMVGTFTGAHGFRGFRDHGLAVRRTVLDAELLACARRAGARVLEGVHVADVERDGTGRVAGVVARTADGTARTWRAPVVVGADGLRSVIARRTGLGRYGRWPRRIALITHFEGMAGDATLGEMHVFAGGYVGVARVAPDLTNVAVVLDVGRGRGIGGEPTQVLERHLARIPELSRRLTRARRVTPVRAVGPFNWHARRTWTPGAALVGDAADFFDPFTGEGIYTALRGAELLTPYLIEATRQDPRHTDVALAAWDRCHRHEFRAKQRVERIIGRIVGLAPVMNAATRGLASHRELADLLVGVTGDFVPPRAVLNLRYILRLARAMFAPHVFRTPRDRS